MPDKDQVARELAQKHYEIEPGITHVFRVKGNAEVENDPAEPIKLLEVNEDTVPSGISPISFGPVPASGIPFASIIIEITPEELTKVHARELALPDGWTIDVFIPRSADEVVA